MQHDALTLEVSLDERRPKGLLGRPVIGNQTIWGMTGPVPYCGMFAGTIYVVATASKRLFVRVQ